MTYEAAQDYLLALPRFTDQGASAYQPGLARMEALMEAMDNPHRRYASVHVAGTNGKGSTASLLAAVATAAGGRTGLHTSPHLFHLTERMRIDGTPAEEVWLAGAVARFRAAMDAIRPSFFEATVALSLLYFAEAHVDLAVVEVGLGGRLDATNILTPRLALITSIGLDHTDLLGATLEAIAWEKAGIIKPGAPVATVAHQPEATAVLRAVAANCSAPFHQVQEETEVTRTEASLHGLQLDVRTPLRRYETLAVGLPGLHQADNALLALRAAELLFPAVQQEAAPVYQGLRDVRRLSGLRGRLEVLQARPLVVADVAHNPEGLATALAFMQAHRAPGGRLSVLLGVMRDKDVPAMARLLAEAEATVFPVPLASERALPAPTLAAVLETHDVHTEPASPVAEGLARFRAAAEPDDALLIAGSHLVAAQLPALRSPA